MDKRQKAHFYRTNRWKFNTFNRFNCTPSTIQTSSSSNSKDPSLLESPLLSSSTIPSASIRTQPSTDQNKNKQSLSNQKLQLTYLFQEVSHCTQETTLISTQITYFLYVHNLIFTRIDVYKSLDTKQEMTKRVAQSNRSNSTSHNS